MPSYEKQSYEEERVAQAVVYRYLTLASSFSQISIKYSLAPDSATGPTNVSGPVSALDHLTRYRLDQKASLTDQVPDIGRYMLLCESTFTDSVGQDRVGRSNA